MANNNGLRVAMIGAVRRNGMAVAALMRSRGLDMQVLLARDQLSMLSISAEQLPTWVRLYEPAGVRSVAGLIEGAKLAGWLMDFDIIHSRCLGAASHCRLLHGLGCAIVEQTVGSDVREVAASGRPKIIDYYKHVDAMAVSQNDHLAILDSLNIRPVTFVPLLADLETYFPDEEVSTTQADLFTIFHPARQDWTYEAGNRDAAKGNNKYRASSRGNDKLIRAVARLVHAGVRCRLVMLERGIDLAESKMLVDQMGLRSHVTWLPPQSGRELRGHFSSADVVADQFSIGTPGLSAFDALLCGARVISRCDDETARRAYGQLPPLMNCQSEDDIEAALNRARLVPIASEERRSNRAWAIAHCGPDIVASKLHDLYTSVRR